MLAEQQTRGTPLQLRVANRHVDDLANLKQQRVDTRVSSLESIHGQTQARGNDEKGLPRHDSVGGLATFDALIVVGRLSKARSVVRVAGVGRDLEHLVEGDEARVGEVVQLRDVADAGAQLLRDDGQGVAGGDGVVDGGAWAAGRRGRRARAGGCGLRAVGLLVAS